jgi:hypothetical protein
MERRVSEADMVMIPAASMLHLDVDLGREGTRIVEEAAHPGGGAGRLVEKVLLVEEVAAQTGTVSRAPLLIGRWATATRPLTAKALSPFGWA